MGSSAKKKREKKQDFQKVKLKVGKAKAKPVNQTNTSFRSKAIVLNQQSLSVLAPSVHHQFQHQVSLLASRTDSQRKESLAYLTTFISAKPVNTPLPQPAGTLLDRVCPLILDGSLGVRTQLLKMLQSLQPEDVCDHVSKILPFLRAGMTHLSRDIRKSAIDVLAWLTRTAGDQLVSCPGGWYKTLESFITLLGWRLLDDASKWSYAKASFANETKATMQVMQALEQFLRAGLVHDGEEYEEEAKSAFACFPLWQVNSHRIPKRSNPYVHLNLFGQPKADDNQILEDREDRLQIFNDHFRPSVTIGIEAARQEGGELGRAAGLLTKVLKHAVAAE